MPYALLAVLVLTMGILLAVLGPRLLGPRGAEHAGRPAAQEVLVAGAPRPGSQALKRAEIEARLQKLGESEPPAGLNQRGAMCYKPVAPPTSAEYVCPVCGSRTQHADDYQIVHLVRNELGAMREKAKELKALGARLDERAFCRKCSPGATAPTPVLVLALPGEPERRIGGVSLDDLKLLSEFLAGAEVHKGARDAETPLKDHLPRLRELLGPDTPRPADGDGVQDLAR